MTDLSRLGEFGFLQRVFGWLQPSEALVGPGDDAAVLPVTSGASLVASTDVLIEGTHFRLDWSTPADVGYKAATVNISDLAAMGARPRWLLVGVGAPPSTTESVLQEVYAGLVEAAGAYGAAVVGGDTVRAQELMLAVTALGEVDGAPMTRSGARVGDVVCVTGPLGRAAAGVNLLLSQNLRGLEPVDAVACMEAHRRPAAQVAQGAALRTAGVRAGMDLSDGLASDVYRLAEASGVGVEIDAAAVPIAPEALRVCEVRGWDPVRLAIGGGEDFELLVALPDPGGVDVELIAIGRIVEEGVWLLDGGERRPMPEGGWDHFRRPEVR